jgi:hypothetical protein
MFVFFVQFYGFVISEKGIEPDDSKIKALKNNPSSKTKEQVKRFLGMASYYRRFMPKFSKITEPIIKLL